MSIDLSGVLNSFGSVLGSNAAGAQPLATQIIQQVAVGAAASGFLAAINHPDVKAALLPFDPLGLAAKPLTPVTASAAASVAVAGPKTLTMAQVLALGTTVAGAEAAGYIVAG